MLKINRLRIEIHTDDGLYGFDELFSTGLNIIASDDNTRGKSSVINAILYCLGCEELLGGQGAKVLTPVFNKQLEDDTKNLHAVLQSCAYLEITNGTNVITIYRTIRNEMRRDKLITVFGSEYKDIRNPRVKCKDYYVLSNNAARSESGFHNFLSKFLNLQLPIVYDSQDNKHLLYIQQILAALIIEQKGGWSDLLYRVPYFGVSGAKQRVIEYFLDIRNNKELHLKRQLEKEKQDICFEWKRTIESIQDRLKDKNSRILNNPVTPEVLTNEKIEAINITVNDLSINDYVQQLMINLSQLNKQEPLVQDNFEVLQKELKETEAQITDIQLELKEFREQKYYEKQNIRKQKHSLEQIKSDIQNNNDAKKLKELGADIGLNFSKEVCPVCKQHINDSLLPFETSVMGIDDNIKHLNSQKKMLEYSIDAHEKKLRRINQVIENNSKVLSDLEKIALSIRSDIMSTGQSYSETIVRKKITIADNIDECKTIQRELEDYKKLLKKLSSKWKELLIREKQLTAVHADYSEKIKYLRDYFVDFLYAFNFRSVANTQKARIKISLDTLLPIIDEFDMKFSASASDNIRMIWAYTLALLSASVKYSTSKINIAIIDEPEQQSIVDNDFRAFVLKALTICNEKKSQIILGVTAKDSKKYIIDDIAKHGGAVINIYGKAFKKLN